METSLQNHEEISWSDIKAMIAEGWKQLEESRLRHQELDRQMQETDRRMQETDRRMQETDKQMQETDRRMKETDRQMQETDRRMQETDRQMQETKILIRELSTRFTSQSGHIIEGLMEPSAIKMFQQKGYDINRCWKNFKKYNKSAGRKLEVDLLLLDDEIAIIVEVKISCTHKDIEHFIEQMHYFKEVCPEYADKEIMLAIAAINYERSSDQFAHEQGLFVIRVSNDDIFALDDPDGDKMLKL